MIEIPFKFAYLTGCLVFLAIWLLLYKVRKDLRKEMLTMSLLIAPLGPLSQILYLRDYWRPELFNGWTIGFEDLLFGFAIGGITAVIYEELFGKKYIKGHTQKHFNLMLLLALVGLIWMIVGNIFLHFNSIYVSISAFIILGISILFFRKDLLLDAFWSGIITGSLMFIFYLIFMPLFPGVIQKWWLLKNLSGVLVLGAPLEELMWGFGWGFFAGPAYEFVTGTRIRKR